MFITKINFEKKAEYKQLLLTYFIFNYFQSQFLLSLQAISTMVHFYMGTKGPENVSLE